MRILVTGGAGFIGSHYARTLVSGGYPGSGDASVTVLDKLTYAGNLANLQPVSDSPRFEFVKGDICDAPLLRSVLPGHDAVINFAAETHVDRSIAGAAEFAATNVAFIWTPSHDQRPRSWSTALNCSRPGSLADRLHYGPGRAQP